MIPLYLRRGFRVQIHPGHPDHAPLFLAAGAEIVDRDDAVVHPWPHAPSGSGPRHNKNGFNISRPPLPYIGEPDDLWEEYCAVQLDFEAQVCDADRVSVDLLLSGAPRPWIVMHVRGYSWQNGAGLHRSYSADNTDDLQRRLIASVGGTIIMLDRNREGRHINASRVCTFMDYSPGQLHELLARADLLVGIDSGPLNFVRFTDTPAIGIWHNHYPADYFLPRAKTLHVVADRYAQRDAQESREWHTLVATDNGPSPAFMAQTIINMLEEQKPPATLTDRGSGGTLCSRSFNANYYQEHRTAGLDYLGFGDWQQRYGRWLVESLNWKGQRILDVGCACGAIVRGFGQAGAIVQGIDINEHMITLGRAQWPDARPILHVCDAANLHLFRDGEFDGLHSAQVAEHWPPHLVPVILTELARVTKPDGLFFCSLDTAELYERQHRDVANEDPTHVCVKAMAWWAEQLAYAGWTLTEVPALRSHPDSFLKQYDWDFWIARRT